MPDLRLHIDRAGFNRMTAANCSEKELKLRGLAVDSPESSAHDGNFRMPSMSSPNSCSCHRRLQRVGAMRRLSIPHIL
jgi:hypothetical protein